MISKQAPLHSVSPDGQTQTPLWQVAPLVQAEPHAPQLRLSDVILTHAFEQLVRPAPHCVAQPPVEQTIPAAHCVEHEPQWSGSVAISVQTPKQRTWPAGHTHWLAEHTVPPEQRTPQASVARIVGEVHAGVAAVRETGAA